MYGRLTATIAQGSVLYPGCVIDQRVHIGPNNLINLSCTISHDTVIEGHSFLAPSVSLAGFVRIGQGGMLGINTTVLGSVFIAHKVQTGGGCVVVKPIEKPGLYVGNPARFVR